MCAVSTVFRGANLGTCFTRARVCLFAVQQVQGLRLRSDDYR
eukprot:COSAG05_NODE_10170_length_579_cov_1.093750_2_plen_41_part_01